MISKLLHLNQHFGNIEQVNQNYLFKTAPPTTTKFSLHSCEPSLSSTQILDDDAFIGTVSIISTTFIAAFISSDGRRAGNHANVVSIGTFSVAHRFQDVGTNVSTGSQA